MTNHTAKFLITSCLTTLTIAGCEAPDISGGGPAALVESRRDSKASRLESIDISPSSPPLASVVVTGGSVGAAFASVAVGPGGDMFVTGSYETSMELQAAEGPVPTSSGRFDAFAARVRSDGTVAWLRPWNSAGWQGAGTVALTSDGMLIAGQFQGDVDFDPGAGDATLSTDGSWDMYVVKLGLDGTFQWAQRFGGAGIDAAFSVAAAPDGGAIVSGQFEQTMQVGASPLTSVGGVDAVVIRLDQSGTVVWARPFGDTDTDKAADLSVAQDGTIFVAATECIPGGACRATARRLAADGSPLAAFVTAGAGDAYGISVVVAGSYAYLTGMFNDGVTFGPDGVENTVAATSAGSSDTFVTKIDFAGGHVWTRTWGDAESDWPSRVASDGTTVWVAAGFEGTIDIDGFTRAGLGLTDAAVVALDVNGAVQSVKVYGGEGDDEAYDLAPDGAGGYAMVGYFQASVNFGTNHTPYYKTAAGEWDGYLVW